VAPVLTGFNRKDLLLMDRPKFFHWPTVATVDVLTHSVTLHIQDYLLFTGFSVGLIRSPKKKRPSRISRWVRGFEADKKQNLDIQITSERLPPLRAPPR
jgi:hypothetical protein